MIGIFEAKTRFPALRESVAASHTPVLVSKRGRPLVMIEPIREELAGNHSNFCTAWQSWRKEHSEVAEDFPEIWRHRGIAPPSLRAFQIEVQLPAGQARFLPEDHDAAGGQTSSSASRSEQGRYGFQVGQVTAEQLKDPEFVEQLGGLKL